MSYFILFLFLAVIFLVIVFVSRGSLLRGILKLLFSRSVNSFSNGQKAEGQRKSDYTQSSKKVFSKDEGEYVDFEEIKE